MKSGRVVILATAGVVVASLSFALGTYNAERFADQRGAVNDAKIDALRSEIARSLLALGAEPHGITGTSGIEDPGRASAGATDARVADRVAIVEEIKQQLQQEMGLLPVQLLRERRKSFVELYTYDNYGSSNYGTAGYLGNGYFITVKHGVVALDKNVDKDKNDEERREARRITSIKIMHEGRALRASVVDTGDATAEVDPGDWAIIKVKANVDLPALNVDLGYGYNFADPIFRLGNDYSKGIILSTGYLGQRTANGLVTCLTDGHPGVSGGGVLNQTGQLVGIPIGRMLGDYRFSFILPLRAEMFRKVPNLRPAESE